MNSLPAIDKSVKADRQAAKADYGFSMRLKEVAGAKGWNQKALAEKSGCPLPA
jgi:hypothetical protein